MIKREIIDIWYYTHVRVKSFQKYFMKIRLHVIQESYNFAFWKFYFTSQQMIIVGAVHEKLP